MKELIELAVDYFLQTHFEELTTEVVQLEIYQDQHKN